VPGVQLIAMESMVVYMVFNLLFAGIKYLSPQEWILSSVSRLCQ